MSAVLNSAVHPPVLGYHPTYHPTYHGSTYHGTSYHPSTYHRTSYYRHYMMIESPAKLRAARAMVWSSIGTMLVCGILWIRQRGRLPPML